MHTVIVTHSHPDHFGGAGWVRDETGADIVTHARFRMIWDRTEPPDLDVEDVAPTTSAVARAAGRAAPWEPPPWGGEGHRFPFKRRMRMRAASVAPAPVQDAGADASASPTPRSSASPGASGSPCTRPVTPTTTSACSTRRRA